MLNNVAEFLQHYGSQYYDPAKAHEYYLQNRQLKGRSTSGMSDKQKETWNSVKGNISSEKKTKIEADKNTKDQKIAEFRAQAEATRQRISEKLKLLSDQLTNKAQDERNRIEAERQAKIDSLPPIPKGLSAKERARFMDERKQQIADIRSNAKSGKDNVKDNTIQNRNETKANITADREQVKTELKAAISTAREDFTKLKESINTSYEKVYQNEYDKVLTNVEGKVKKTRKRRG